MTTPINTQKTSWMNGGNLLDNKLIDNFLRSRWYPGIIYARSGELNLDSSCF